MHFKIVERDYPGTLTKLSQLSKAKQFLKRFGNRDNRQHKNKIDKFFPSGQLYVQS